jgi:hypothetical protein
MHRYVATNEHRDDSSEQLCYSWHMRMQLCTLNGERCVQYELDTKGAAEWK